MAVEARHNWHLSKSWQTFSACADAKTIRRPLGNGSVIALFLKSGSPSSLHDVSKKDPNVGLSANWFRSIIYTSNNDKELVMSAVEFGLASPRPFLLPQVPFEQPVTGLEALAARYEALSQLSRSIASMPFDDLSRNLLALLRPIFPCDLANIVIFNQATSDVPWRSLGAGQLAPPTAALEQTTVWSTYEEERPIWIDDWQTDELLAVRDEAQNTEGVGYRSLCRLPLHTPQGCLGVLSLATAQPHRYSEQDKRLLSLAADQVALGLAYSSLHTELKKLKNEFDGDEIYVESEQRSEPSFEEIVGRSPALQRVLRQVEVVAPTDSGVLIQGETGTGKELIAHAIHNRSARRDRPFVKVNCAAIPSGLLESELFGHEKGAFTGAIMRKPGRFELADKGTLFLDEVGDIPLELQAKLLRVLQEHEFERLGSTRTQQVDVRVIAATHQDLKQMVEEGTFRSDLYYRLHVFPLTVPALRERREDIPLIVRHFVDKYASRMNRNIETIPVRTMEAFANYAWPGNVRELQNFVERAVILSNGSSLRAPLEELKQETAPTNLSTLEEMEREHVLRALKESNWVTGGPKGAAVRLGMKRTTLAYRIRKLGIPVRPQ
jgi:formate hydrogenlyase transcriptional activator